MSDQVRREVAGTKKLTDEERAWLAEHGHKLIAGERMTREYDDLERDYRQIRLCLWQLIRGQEDNATLSPEQWLLTVKAIVLGGDE